MRIYFTSMIFVFTLFGSTSFAQTIPNSYVNPNSPHMAPHLNRDLEEERKEYIEEQERAEQKQAYEEESSQKMNNVQDAIKSQQDEINQDAYIPKTSEDTLSKPKTTEQYVPRSFSPP